MCCRATVLQNAIAKCNLGFHVLCIFLSKNVVIKLLMLAFHTQNQNLMSDSMKIQHDSGKSLRTS